MNIGDRIKEKRLELNLSQDELAKKVGYKSRSSIQKIEASRNLPLDKVTKMARALGCTEAYLMGWTEDCHISDTNLPIISEDANLSKAIELFKAYSKANPDVQAAVEILLKSQLPNS